MIGKDEFDKLYMLHSALTSIDAVDASYNDEPHTIGDSKLDRVLTIVKDIDKGLFLENFSTNIINNIHAAVLDIYINELNIINKDINLSPISDKDLEDAKSKFKDLQEKIK